MPEKFVARDANFAEKVRGSFARQGFMRHLGAELAAVSEGASEVRVAFREALNQQHGYFHGGVAGAIADSAAGYAAFSLTPAGSSVLTVEYKLNLFAPAQGEALIARGSVIRAGRTLIVAKADVFTERGGAETLCGTLLSTIMVLPATEERAEG
jgi:uncharacterized protein (TIGR00369 family)